MSAPGVKWVARSAMGTALAVLAQLLGKQLPAVGVLSAQQLATGTLVNCVLLVFAVRAGLGSGLVIGAVSPVLALLLGLGPALPVLTPLIACGNAALVLAAWACSARFRRRLPPGFAAGAAVKCALLWSTAPLLLSAVGAEGARAAAVKAMLSWPQGVTALLGGALALLLLSRIPAEAAR